MLIYLVKYDKGGDEFYDLILVFYKLVWGSLFDGVLYWYCCILVGGGDLFYVVRCLLVIVIEDIGNVDLWVMEVVFNVWDIF